MASFLGKNPKSDYTTVQH